MSTYLIGFDAIIAPNARWHCSNLILFTDQIEPDNLKVVATSEVNWSAWRKKHLK